MNIPVNYWYCGIYSLLCIIICPLMAYLGKGPVKNYIERKPGIWANILQILFKTPVIVAIALLLIWFALNSLDLSDNLRELIRDSYQIFVLINIAWLVNTVIAFFINKAFVLSKDRIEDESVDINMVKTLNKIISIIIWIITIIMALSILGIDIKALVATLGIGGVALALAGQDTAKNLIGGITILGDRTFRIGDRIVVEGKEGVVEDIGLRSTRLRTTDNRLATIPNGKLTDATIENITLEQSRKVTLKLGLTYDTTPEKMQVAMDILKNLPKEVSTMKEPVTVGFNAFNDFSLEIKFVYELNLNRPTNDEVLNANSEINMKILDHFNAAGLNFAFPTQTVIVEK